MAAHILRVARACPAVYSPPVSVILPVSRPRLLTHLRVRWSAIGQPSRPPRRQTPSIAQRRCAGWRSVL